MDGDVKFRAWYEEVLDGKWKMADVRDLIWDHGVIVIDVFTDDNRLFDQPLNYKLMRFSGFHDRKRTKKYPKGQEIYEGDIVWWGKDDYAPASEILYRDGAFWVTDGINSELLIDVLNGAEVIGNIYETPELLAKE